MENIGSLVATMGIDISDFKKKLDDAQKTIKTVSNSINSVLGNSVKGTEQKLNSFSKELEKANKVYAKTEQKTYDLYRAELMLKKGLGLLGAGIIDVDTFTNRYSKNISLLNSVVKNSYGVNLKYEGILKNVKSTLNDVTKEQKEAAASAASAAKAQEKYNRSVVSNTFKRGASALKTYNAELKKIQIETEQARIAQDKLDKTYTSSFNSIQTKSKKHGSIITSTLKTARAAVLGYITILGTMAVIDFTKDIVNAGVELDSLNRSFVAITKSTKQAKEEFEFVREVADKYGLDVRSLEQSYLGLLAASQKTNLEGPETRKLFEAVAASAAVLGMSIDDTRGTIRAFIQMISKGNVQAEELRGQLGERLYGAFNKAAQAMGVSTQELNDMLKAGNVLANDLIPKMSDLLINEFGEAAKKAAEGPRGSFAALNNQMLDLKRTLSDAGIIQLLQLMAQEATAFLKSLDKETIRSTVVVGIATIANTIAILKRTAEIAFKSIQLGFYSLIDVSLELTNVLINGPIENTKRLIELFNKIPIMPDIQLPSSITDFGDDITKNTQAVREKVIELSKELNNLMFNPEMLPGDKIIDAVTKVKEAVEKTSKIEAAVTVNKKDVKKLTEELEYFVDGKRYVLEIEVDAPNLAKATTEQLDAFEKQAKKSYEYATEQAKKYAESVISWEDKIKDARLSTEDKVRELGRKGLSDELQWADRKLEAEEKLAAAKEALRKKDYDLAEDLAKDAESLYSGLAEEITKTDDGDDVVVKSLKDTKEIAVNGVQTVGDFIQELYGKQKQNAEDSKKEWTKTANTIQEKLDDIVKKREANIEIKLQGVINAQNKINALIKDETKYITVVTKNVTESKEGGPIVKAETGAYVKRSGQLGGYGGGDKIKAMLESGEFIVRKEAVAKYGSSFFSALNSMDIPGVFDGVKARVGGLMSSIPVPQSTIPAFASGGLAQGSSETLVVRFQAGDVEAPVEITDPSSREAMKKMAKEMSRMKMVYRN